MQLWGCHPTAFTNMSALTLITRASGAKSEFEVETWLSSKIKSPSPVATIVEHMTL